MEVWNEKVEGYTIIYVSVAELLSVKRNGACSKSQFLKGHGLVLFARSVFFGAGGCFGAHRCGSWQARRTHRVLQNDPDVACFPPICGGFGANLSGI